MFRSKHAMYMVLWIALMAFVLLLTGCGDDDDDDSGGGDESDDDTVDDDDTGDDDTSDDDDDAAAPEVAGSEPGDGREHVKLSTAVTLSFTMPMDGASVEENFNMAGVTGTFAWNAGGDVVTFTPSDLLDEGTSYTVVLSSDAASEDGIPMEANYILTFTTIHLWTEFMDGSGNDSDAGRGIALDGQNNVYITGWVKDAAGDTDIRVAIYDAEGAQQWTDTYGHPDNDNDYGEGIAVDADGNYYITGYIVTVAEQGNVWTRKYLATRSVDWTETYNGAADGYDYGYGIAIDTDGSVYVAGNESVAGEMGDIWLRKYDADGGELWTVTFGGVNHTNDKLSSVALDSDGSVYVTGSVNDADDSDQMWTRKYDNGGNTLWTDTYDHTSGLFSDIGGDIALDEDGNVYVVGYSFSDISDQWSVVRKLDGDGNEIWTETFEGEKGLSNTAWGVAVDPDGNVYVTGSFNAGSPYSDAYVMKLDADGNEIWTETISGSEDGSHTGYDIAVDQYGNSYATGRAYNGAATGFDIWIRVFDTDGNWAE